MSDAVAQLETKHADDLDQDSGEPIFASDPSDHPVSLKARLIAWWNGDEIDTGTAKKAQSRRNDHVNNWNSADEAPLSAMRLAAIEAVWGDGFLVPGGKRFARKMLAILAPTSKMSVLDLTADLGGTARAIAEQYNLWMDAFDPIGQLATEGHRRSVAAGLGKRVPIRPIDIEEFELRSRRYNAIYSRERLFTVANKDRVLDQMVVGLKARGQILITDFMVAPDAASIDATATLGRNGEPPHLWSMRQYRSALERRGFKILLAQDITREYVELIHAAWSNVPGIIRRENIDRRHVDLIVEEGEMWLERSRALENGDLIVGRIHAQIS